ncbi:MAG: hypothetical protein HWE27_09185 [Gammaproteobacteria bacterium]|nr:hypothetical protein [Gammaproteobacteria bacterium]
MLAKKWWVLILGTVTAAVAMNAVIAKEFSLSVNGKPVIKIEAEKEKDFDRDEFKRYMKKHGYDYESHYRANRKLRERLYRLELAVMQLQESVYELQMSDIHKQPEQQFTCLFRTKHRGTFMGFGLSKLEAEGNAIAKCEAKEGDFWCKGTVSCDSN